MCDREEKVGKYSSTVVMYCDVLWNVVTRCTHVACFVTVMVVNEQFTVIKGSS